MSPSSTQSTHSFINPGPVSTLTSKVIVWRFHSGVWCVSARVTPLRVDELLSVCSCEHRRMEVL
ncbi:hypothetical protein P692DRAFT_2080194 [Suillus brevipes Sb2]|nr:hypothetical protein P692DRAFT_2080194 [Suillus brevipes Sb2]